MIGATGLTPVELVVIALLVAVCVLGVTALVKFPPHGSSSRHATRSPPSDLETWLGRMPQHADLRSISDRLHTVERICDVVRAEVGGMKDAIGRIEHMQNMLLAQQLEAKT